MPIWIDPLRVEARRGVDGVALGFDGVALDFVGDALGFDGVAVGAVEDDGGSGAAGAMRLPGVALAALWRVGVVPWPGTTASAVGFLTIDHQPSLLD